MYSADFPICFGDLHSNVTAPTYVAQLVLLQLHRLMVAQRAQDKILIDKRLHVIRLARSGYIAFLACRVTPTDRTNECSTPTRLT
jgi:hypothetical protein